MQQLAGALLAMHDNIMNRWRACIVCRRGLCERREASDRFNYNREWDKWDFKWRSKGTAEGSSLPNWNPIGTSSGVIKMNLALVQFKAATWREFRGTLLIHWIQHQCLSPGRLFMWGKVGGRHQTDPRPKFRTLLMSAKVTHPNP